jgi:membrane protein YqaA with SNARE-associated domain
MSTGKPKWSPVTRAIVFTILTLLLGIVTVALRASGEGSPLHPQLLLLLYSIPANTGLSLFSHEVALLDYGAHAPLFLSVISATVGTVIAGFLDWRVFVPLLEWDKVRDHRERRWVRSLLSRFQRAPFLVIVVTAATPIPFFPFKMMAFSVGYPMWRYLAALTIGRAPRYLAIAWLGDALNLPRWLLLASLATVLVAAGVKEMASRGMPALRAMARVGRQQA